MSVTVGFSARFSRISYINRLLSREISRNHLSRGGLSCIIEGSKTPGFARTHSGTSWKKFPLTVDKAVKVFARLFQKAAQSRARSPRRRPQTAKSPFRRFLFAALRSKVCFSLCAYMVKEKASFSFALFLDDNSFCLQSEGTSWKKFIHSGLSLNLMRGDQSAPTKRNSENPPCNAPRSFF